MSALPTGTVTFLFTDIEGSTRMLQALGDGFREVVERHNALLREAIEANAGVVVRTEGDAFFAVFERAPDAVAAAVAAQRTVQAERWPDGHPVRVRVGMHTGQGDAGGDDYVGLDVHRAARIAGAGYGGQVLLSDATRAIADNSLPEGVTLKGLGPHRLKDLPRAEELFQVVIEGLPSDFPELSSRRQDRLPTYRTSFLGRESERQRLEALLEPGRIVTLTGPGGTGKTRLAVECARASAERFPDGAVFADLAPVHAPDLVPAAIASALGAGEQPGRPPIDVIRDHLGQRSVLIVLDNLEQVIEAAPVAAELIEASPGSAVLATSRSPLQVSGEQRFPLDGLEDDAVDLFVDRARQVDPSFEPTDDELADIRAICARLDGLPLAIELAASRTALLPVAELRARLETHLGETGSGARDLPERQRDLERLVAWSHDLLSPEEQTVFARLGVFVGGWEPEALRAVVDPEDDLDAAGAVVALLNHSLVRRPVRTTARMSMLETIRSFAAGRLAESGEEDETRARHAAHFAGLAEQAEPHLTGREHQVWLAALDADAENMRAAMLWALEHDPTLGIRIGAASWRFWQVRGRISEVRSLLGDLVDTPAGGERTRLNARGLAALGSLAYWQGDLTALADLYTRSARIFEEIGDEAGIAESARNLSYLAMGQGDVDRALVLILESIERFEALGDVAMAAKGRVALSVIRLRLGDRDEAYRQVSAALADLEPRGEWLETNYAHDVLARLQVERGEIDAAIGSYLQLIDNARAVGSETSMVIGLASVAVAVSAMGDHARAIRLAAAHQGLTEELGMALPEGVTVFMDPRPPAIEALGDAEIERLWDEGRAMSLPQALELVEDLRPSRPSPR